VEIPKVSSGLEPIVILRTDDVSAYGASSSDRLELTSSKLVQVTAHLNFMPAANDFQVLETGTMNCFITHGPPGGNTSQYAYIAGSDTLLDISERSEDSGFIGTMDVTGWFESSVDTAFAVKCYRFGANPIDVRMNSYTLHAIAIG
jgi:hypothetical protein